MHFGVLIVFHMRIWLAIQGLILGILGESSCVTGERVYFEGFI